MQSSGAQPRIIRSEVHVGVVWVSCLLPTIGAPVGSWLKGLRNGDVVGPDWMHIL